MRRVSPAIPVDRERTKQAIDHLRAARDLLQQAGCPRATAATMRALASAGLVSEIRKLANQLRTEKREKSRGLSLVHDRAYRAAYALRYEPVSFADDGPDRADRALDLIGAQGKLTDEDRKILESAIKTDAGTSGGKELFAALGALRERLLRMLRPDERPLSVIAAPRADVMKLLKELVADVRRRISSSRSGLDRKSVV
mgnify:CR=1 FL=1